MPHIALQYCLPPGMAVQEVLHEFGSLPLLEQGAQFLARRCFFDSFDWRLYAAGRELEWENTARSPRLNFYDRRRGKILACLASERPPRFARDLPPGFLCAQLRALLEVRALLPVVEIASQCQRLIQVDGEGKTVVRISVEQNRVSGPDGGDSNNLEVRVVLQPMKGYGRVAKKTAAALESIGLLPAKGTLLLPALAAVQRRPRDYSSKFKVRLEAKTRADVAMKAIFARLLEAMKANEAGIVADLDSEFLHDFRVAVRRTRTALAQGKKIFPQADVAHFRSEFSWLGSTTGRTRDLDVYLINFDGYKESLPVTIRDDLDGLYGFLEKRKKDAHAELVEQLSSRRYRQLLEDWQGFLIRPSPSDFGTTTVKALADGRIWQLYRRIVKDGRAIDTDSPAPALHELRKSCKKLRYLMEFFRSLYPRKEIKALIKTLKGLQDNLGRHQDYEVQENTLRQFSQEMMGSPETPARTLLAMGVLIQDLDKRRQIARAEFAARFDDFDSERNHALYEEMFKSSAKGKDG